MRARTSLKLTLFTLAVTATSVFAQDTNSVRPGQTFGYGAGKVLKFTYKQNFDCVDEPKTDLNYNNKPSESDPAELKTPICQVGTQSNINPPGQVGNPEKTTEPIYVLVPMFSVDKDQNPNDAISCRSVVRGTLCGPKLGDTLIKLFGAIPEGFKEKPLVYSQCPDPGLPAGTCTMHASRLDLGPVLAALGLIPPPTSNIFLPTPNHSHVLLNVDINIKPIWWQVIPVLVLNQNDWPPQDGSSGITSLTALREAEKAKRAIEAPSNFFLYFSSYTMKGSMAEMNMQ